MQLARIIQLPDHLNSTEKIEFLQDVILYLHDQLEETESVPQQRAFGFIGTTGAIAVAWSICGLGMVAPVIAIPGAIVIAGCSLVTGISLAKDVIEFPELIDIQKRLISVLESKEVEQWVKLWEEVGTEGFLRRLQYACMGGFSAKGTFRHKSGSHPFDVAALFGGNQSIKPWEKVAAGRTAIVPNNPSTLPPEQPIEIGSAAEGEAKAPLTHSSSVQPNPNVTLGATQKNSVVVVLFDFNCLRTEPDKFAHLRVIGGTGVGKTTFVDWLLDVLGGERFVITPKKKSWNWVGLKVYGLWFDYETIRQKLQWIHAEMYHRYPLMEQGEIFELTNFVVDEWRLINTNIKVIKERDSETGQNIEIAPSAKAMMKDIITVARESMLRLIALAQGENVASWGFEGESDLEECFTDIRLGEFAIDHARGLRNQCRKDSDDYEYWAAVLHELEWQDKQRTREGKSIPCCMVGKHPARISDLTDWKREIPDNSSEESEQTKLSVTDPSTHFPLEATLPERKLPPIEAEGTRKPDGISAEVFSAKIAEALAEASEEASTPLFDGLDRDGKLLMLRLLLTKKLGKEKTILLAWGLKSGGRSHDKYKLASELLDAMTGELSDLGFNEDNNWGVD